MKAQLHPKEPERLAALARYDILDTPAEPEFDNIASMVADICNTPIAVVNFIANDRQWFKSEFGLGVREMPLEPSLCAHAVLQEDLMIVPDTLADPRFIDNPLVLSNPGLRFYAGALLHSDDGLPLGTLCVLDQKPRQLAAHQIRALQTLAQHVMLLLEMRRARKREAELKDTVEKTLAAHQRMIATVCHDLRTPVSTISLTTEYLRLHSDPDLQAIAVRLHRMSGNITRLIDDLQDFETLLAGRQNFHLLPVPAHTLLDEVRDAFTVVARNAGVQLHVEPTDTSLSVLTDRYAASRMLGNLVQNAIKFTGKDGRVTVSALAEGSRVEFSVADTGIGIAPDDLPHLFDPHWRGQIASAQPGSGLGLSIVDMLARELDTLVRVRSELNVGSRFSFSLEATSLSDVSAV